MKTSMPTRRRFLKTGAAASTLMIAGPAILRRAVAQEADLAPYKSAKIDWQQTSGETITVAVIPASYFENLITIAPQFKALTGIDVRFEKIPPAQIRQKSVIDLTSKTGTYATHAADPMYYSLYAANKWVEPLDSYLADPFADRRRLVQVRRHHSRPGAPPTVSTASCMACPMTAKSPFRSIARTFTTPRA